MQTAGLATDRSLVPISPAVATYGRQLSMPSLRGQLISWGVNGHTTTDPVSAVWQLGCRGVRLYRVLT